MSNISKVLVSERALNARINRRLQQDGEQLRTVRTPWPHRELGRHFIVNQNAVIARDVKPETLARELGVLRPWEQLANPLHTAGAAL